MSSQKNGEKLLFLLVLVLTTFFVGCKLEASPNLLFECSDGELVGNISACPVPEVAEIQKTTPGNNTATAANPPVEKPVPAPRREGNFSTLRKKPEEEIVGENYLDLNGWSSTEIVSGMGMYNNKFRTAYALQIAYAEDHKRYFVGSGYDKKDDPFWIARYPYQEGNKEYNINGLRINLVLSPHEFINLVEEKHNDTKLQVLWPEEWAAWKSIVCTRLNSCRDISVIRCKTGGHELYMWSHTTPGQGYTENVRYTMQAMDDFGESFETFEKFYCTPI